MENSTVLSNDKQLVSEARAQATNGMIDTPEERVLREFNAKYAVVHTNSTYILIEKEEGFVLDTSSSLRLLHHNDFLDTDTKKKNTADFWLKHPNRRTYTKIVFDPSKPGHYVDGRGGLVYNIFSGFAFTPEQGDCSLFWNHVYEVICNGDQSSYLYIRKWMACVVQQPKVLATALVLRGLQGTGKSIFVTLFGNLFGRYFLTVTNLDQIIGKFNSHLQYAYLINANEAIWGGHKKEIGALKALITDSTIFIEAKGKDGFLIDNCRHLIVTSNEGWAVPRDLDDRRFFVLDVSPKRKEDIEYFKALDEQMRHGGASALLYDLLHEDLATFDPRCMPVNGIGFDMKMKGADTAVRYIFEALRAGALNLACLEGGWTFYVQKPTGDIFDFYKDWCRAEGLRHQTHGEFGENLKKLIPSCKKTRPLLGGQRIYCYNFPVLEVCRKEFQAFVKEPESIWEI